MQQGDNSNSIKGNKNKIKVGIDPSAIIESLIEVAKSLGRAEEKLNQKKK